MITIIGRRLIIPDCDRILGVTEDANTKIKIKLSSDTVERYFPDSANTDNVGITLVMKYEDGTEFSSVAFTKSDNGVHEGYVNLVGVTKVGLLNARALLTYSEETKDGDLVSTVTTSMQTEEDYFYISEDIEAGDINENGSTLTAWSQTLEDIKEETKNLDTAVTTATNAASSASNSAETAVSSALNASFSAGNAATSETNAMGYASAAESAKDAAVSAKDESAVLVGKYSKHLPDYNNPHKVTAEQVGAYTKNEVNDLLSGKSDSGHTHENYDKHLSNVSNPHKVTAEQVGAFDKQAVRDMLSEIGAVASSAYSELNNHKGDHSNPHKVTASQIGAYSVSEINKLLDEKASADDVFEVGSFGWTDFTYNVVAAEWDNTYSLSGNQISGGGAEFTIHCKGKTLGFDYTCDNPNASSIEVNGVQYTSGSGSIPLTFMESDIIVYCSLAVFTFSNMTIQSIKGVSELEAQIGDIDTALDGILSIQNGLIGGGAV